MYRCSMSVHFVRASVFSERRGYGLCTFETMSGSSIRSSCMMSALLERTYPLTLTRPGFMNSLAGLISTVVNVYSAQNGDMSITAEVTMCVTGGCTGLFLILFVLYNFWAVKRIKNRHNRQLQEDIERGRATAEQAHEHDHEGPLEKVKRKAQEPALEPSSVI